MNTMTKEALWNEIKILYPNHFEIFSQWIDKYKTRVNWLELFNEKTIHSPVNGFESVALHAPKFHELPAEMQAGIFVAYVRECGGGYFNYSSRSENIADDIRTYFRLRSNN